MGETQRQKEPDAAFPEKFADFMNDMKKVAATERAEGTERTRTCTRYVHFPIINDREDPGIVIDRDYYGIVVDSVKERGLHIRELAFPTSNFYMLSDEGVYVRIREEFDTTASKNRKVILVYGTYEDRQKFDAKEGLNKLAPPGFEPGSQGPKP